MPWFIGVDAVAPRFYSRCRGSLTVDAVAHWLYINTVAHWLYVDEVVHKFVDAVAHWL